MFSQAIQFAKSHPYLSIGTAGLAVVGYMGYRAVRWILEKTGLIAKTDKIAQEKFANQVTPREPIQIEIPDDGNCLFHSFLVAAKFHLPHQFDQTTTYQDLRQEVVNYMRENKDNRFLQSLMSGAFQDEHDKRVKELEEDITSSTTSTIPEVAQIAANAKKELATLKQNTFDVDAYLEHMSQDRIFGNMAEIYALAKLYPVNIMVYTEGSDKPLSFPYSEEKDLPELHVSLKNNHYTVVIPTS